MNPPRFESVWQNVSPALQQEIVDFWIAENALRDPEAARRRARQAVCIARGSDGQLAGLCSVEARVVPRLRQRLYYYRTYVGAAHRGSKLIYPMLLQARQLLQDYNRQLPEPECIGILIEFENKSLGQHFPIAFDDTSKFGFIGYSPRGLDLRVSYFDGVQLQPPEKVQRSTPAG
ncbi:MAG TPA: hypothetical protein VFY12_13550 [Arenimonas sp.]|nr:hypothetical protein [Arenimonas sp.]